jgi:hypothetical protein
MGTFGKYSNEMALVLCKEISYPKESKSLVHHRISKQEQGDFKGGEKTRK